MNVTLYTIRRQVHVLQCLPDREVNHTPDNGYKHLILH